MVSPPEERRLPRRIAAALPAGGLLTVRDLLGEAELHLELAAGATGLDRPIRWAHAIELPDPRPYLRGGELVLTMGSSLTNAEDCRGFVRAVRERDASGIGFGLGNFHDAIPAGRGEACEKSGLSLLAVPYEIPFIAITEHLAERFAALRVERARRAHRLEAGLLDVLAGGGGLSELAAHAARELRGVIVIADLEGELEAIAGSESGVVDSDAARAIVRQILARGGPDDRRIGWQGDGLSVDLAPIRHRRRTIGWLGWIHPAGEASKVKRKASGAVSATDMPCGTIASSPG